MIFRSWISRLAASSIALLALGGPAAPPGNGLRNAAHQARVLVGTAVRPSLFSETAYSATLSREYNMIEPEDIMKWWVVHEVVGGAPRPRFRLPAR